MIFPIAKFRFKIKRSEKSELNSKIILNLIEDYLEDRDYNYIVKRANSIWFHHANIGLLFWKYNSLLINGNVRITEKKDEIIVENGSWIGIIFIILFGILLILSQTNISTFDKTDVKVLWFILTFSIINFIWESLNHRIFSKRIKDLIDINNT